MTKEFEFYHGLVFARLIHEVVRNIKVRLFSSSSNASYVLDDEVGVYIKYSSKRLSPWRFTFSRSHFKELVELVKISKSVFLILVCGEDGILCMNIRDSGFILEASALNEESHWISAARSKRKMYLVKCSSGVQSFKVSQTDFPNILFGVA